jgi:hypothetical protein
MSARERQESHERNSGLAEATEERAPCWLRLQGAFTIAALDAIAAGSDPAKALAEAVAESDADVEEIEWAQGRLQTLTELDEAARAAALIADSKRQLVSIDSWDDDDAQWRAAIESARRARGYNL